MNVRTKVRRGAFPLLGLLASCLSTNCQPAAPPPAQASMLKTPFTVRLPLPATGAYPAVAVDGAGRVVVAWSQQIPNDNAALRLLRYAGGRWEALGGSDTGRGLAGTIGTASAPSIALDSSGNPSVAWQDYTSGNDEICFRRWDGAGSRWLDVDGSAGPEGISHSGLRLSGFPSLALTAGGSPVIAWEEHYGPRADIFVRSLRSGLTGSSWKDVGGQGLRGGFNHVKGEATQPSLALDQNGNPVVAWSDDEAGPRRIYVRRWDGLRWQEIPRVLGDTSAKGHSVTLRIAPGGQEVLTWQEGEGMEAVLALAQGRSVRRTPIPGLAWPLLALDSGQRPLVAFSAGDSMEVRRFANSGWQPMAEFRWRREPVDRRPQDRAMAFAYGASRACVVWIEPPPAPELVLACLPL